MLMRQVGFISYFIIIIFVDIANTKIILEKKNRNQYSDSILTIYNVNNI